jgi:hypothetical protein
MVLWQVLESELATLFSRLTAIPPAMAIQIFYSARSFNGRVDIYIAGIIASSVCADTKSLARSVIKKAKAYAEYRNKFAHDLPLLRQQGQPAKFDVLMVDGKGQFQPDDLKNRYIADAVNMAQIIEAADCFERLGKIVQDFWSQLPTASLDKLHERLDALPNLPRPKDRSPKSSKSKRQRPPSLE